MFRVGRTTNNAQFLETLPRLPCLVVVSDARVYLLTANGFFELLDTSPCGGDGAREPGDSMEVDGAGNGVVREEGPGRGGGGARGEGLGEGARKEGSDRGPEFG